MAASASAGGPYTVTVRATDSAGAYVESDFVLTVTNPAPGVTPIADRSSSDGAAIDLDIAASFGDDDAMTYTASGLPAGLGISGAGVITGTLPANASAAGPYTVIVTATDAQGATTTDTFTWTVTNPAPSVTPIADQADSDNAAININVAPNFADDDAMTYTASGLPAGLGISGAGVITGTLPANASAASPYTVTVTATDAQGATTTDTFTWTVTNPAPGVSPIADQASSDGAAIDLDIAASFGDDDAMTYTASGLPAGLGISGAGVITGTLPANASAASPYTVTVTATDAQGATTTDTFTWIVASSATAPKPGPPVAQAPRDDTSHYFNVIKQFLGANGNSTRAAGDIGQAPPVPPAIDAPGAKNSAAAALPITVNVIEHANAWRGKYFYPNTSPMAGDDDRASRVAQRTDDPASIDNRPPAPDDRAASFDRIATLIEAVADVQPDDAGPVRPLSANGFRAKLRAAAER